MLNGLKGASQGDFRKKLGCCVNRSDPLELMDFFCKFLDSEIPTHTLGGPITKLIVEILPVSFM